MDPNYFIRRRFSNNSNSCRNIHRVPYYQDHPMPTWLKWSNRYIRIKYAMVEMLFVLSGANLISIWRMYKIRKQLEADREREKEKEYISVISTHPTAVAPLAYISDNNNNSSNSNINNIDNNNNNDNSDERNGLRGKLKEFFQRNNYRVLLLERSPETEASLHFSPSWQQRRLYSSIGTAASSSSSSSLAASFSPGEGSSVIDRSDIDNNKDDNSDELEWKNAIQSISDETNVDTVLRLLFGKPGNGNDELDVVEGNPLPFDKLLPDFDQLQENPFAAYLHRHKQQRQTHQKYSQQKHLEREQQQQRQMHYRRSLLDPISQPSDGVSLQVQQQQRMRELESLQLVEAICVLLPREGNAMGVSQILVELAKELLIRTESETDPSLMYRMLWVYIYFRASLDIPKRQLIKIEQHLLERVSMALSQYQCSAIVTIAFFLRQLILEEQSTTYFKEDPSLTQITRPKSGYQHPSSDTPSSLFPANRKHTFRRSSPQVYNGGGEGAEEGGLEEKDALYAKVMWRIMEEIKKRRRAEFSDVDLIHLMDCCMALPYDLEETLNAQSNISQWTLFFMNHLLPRLCDLPSAKFSLLLHTLRLLPLSSEHFSHIFGPLTLAILHHLPNLNAQEQRTVLQIYADAPLESVETMSMLMAVVEKLNDQLDSRWNKNMDMVTRCALEVSLLQLQQHPVVLDFLKKATEMIYEKHSRCTLSSLVSFLYVLALTDFRHPLVQYIGEIAAEKFLANLSQISHNDIPTIAWAYQRLGLSHPDIDNLLSALYQQLPGSFYYAPLPQS